MSFQSTMLLGVVLLGVAQLVVMLHFTTPPRYAECRYAEYHYAECLYAECHYAECRYAECHHAECRGANRGTKTLKLSKRFISRCDQSNKLFSRVI